MHTTGVYEGQRAETSARRVFILTRSAYAGQQRNAAVTWSGDIHGNWDVFRKQIPAGLQLHRQRHPVLEHGHRRIFRRRPRPGRLRGTFHALVPVRRVLPMFRVHGTGKPKEIWRFAPDIQQILIRYNELRHRLLPYIYSTSWQVTSEGYTIMRPLAFDFRRDDNVLNLADQFMFGPAIMVNPVVQACRHESRRLSPCRRRIGLISGPGSVSPAGSHRGRRADGHAAALRESRLNHSARPVRCNTSARNPPTRLNCAFIAARTARSRSTKTKATITITRTGSTRPSRFRGTRNRKR